MVEVRGEGIYVDGIQVGRVIPSPHGSGLWRAIVTDANGCTMVDLYKTPEAAAEAATGRREALLCTR